LAPLGADFSGTAVVFFGPGFCLGFCCDIVSDLLFHVKTEVEKLKSNSGFAFVAAGRVVSNLCAHDGDICAGHKECHNNEVIFGNWPGSIDSDAAFSDFFACTEPKMPLVEDTHGFTKAAAGKTPFGRVRIALIIKVFHVTLFGTFR
jgi:hypothetical protein